VEGFGSLAGDPTFEKYREKLDEKIASKERVIREINRQKAVNKNQQLAASLFGKDDSPEAIQLFCRSALDDGKTQLLLDSMDVLIKKRMAEL
jgi:hypothetical protein